MYVDKEELDEPEDVGDIDSVTVGGDCHYHYPYKEDGPGWLGYILIWAFVFVLALIVYKQGVKIDDLRHEIVTIQIKE